MRIAHIRFYHAICVHSGKSKATVCQGLVSCLSRLSSPDTQTDSAGTAPTRTACVYVRGPIDLHLFSIEPEAMWGQRSNSVGDLAVNVHKVLLFFCV